MDSLSRRDASMARTRRLSHGRIVRWHRRRARVWLGRQRLERALSSLRRREWYDAPRNISERRGQDALRDELSRAGRYAARARRADRNRFLGSDRQRFLCRCVRSFSFFAIESLRFTTEGRGGWRAGSAFISTLALRYSLGDSLALLLSADGIYASADRLSGARIADTGGFLAYVTPSALMQLAPTTMLRVALQIPVAHVNAGTQTESVAFLVSLVFTHIPEPEAVPATSSSPMI
jgi:hypothetical protein